MPIIYFIVWLFLLWMMSKFRWKELFIILIVSPNSLTCLNHACMNIYFRSHISSINFIQWVSFHPHPNHLAIKTFLIVTKYLKLFNLFSWWLFQLLKSGFLTLMKMLRNFPLGLQLFFVMIVGVIIRPLSSITWTEFGLSTLRFQTCKTLYSGKWNPKSVCSYAQD